jgi:hypothetical protein
MAAALESTLTPAGASLIIRRRGRWSTVSIDRWRITDATEVEQWWADGVALAATYACFARGRTTPVESIIGAVDWAAMCPREDELALVQAFVGVERHDFTLVANYIRDRVWPDAPSYQRWITAAESHNVSASELPIPPQTLPARQSQTVYRRMDRVTERSAMTSSIHWPAVTPVSDETPAAAS